MEKITCSYCGGERISRDKEIPIFANCENCGFSWNLFLEKMIMRPEMEDVVGEHIKQYFASVDAGLRGQWLASLAKIITGPEMKIALQKINNAVVIQRLHVPTGKIKWNYVLDFLFFRKLTLLTLSPRYPQFIDRKRRNFAFFRLLI